MMMADRGRVELPEEDPLGALVEWLRAAEGAGIDLPERACLATATPDGAPSARMVLFKGLDDGRLLFFTDYRSRKARELEANPRAALVFYWRRIGGQIRVEGTVERLDGAASDRYFLTRPRGSRIAAWTSRQSAEIATREELERHYAEVEARFRDREVTRPPHWGGFALRPARVEFWREGGDRLHDRVAFDRTRSGWRRVLLQP